MLILVPRECIVGKIKQGRKAVPLSHTGNGGAAVRWQARIWPAAAVRLGSGVPGARKLSVSGTQT